MNISPETLFLAEDLLKRGIVTGQEYLHFIKTGMWSDGTSFDLDATLPEPKCECGAASTGIEDYAAGHAQYCPVRDS